MEDQAAPATRVRGYWQSVGYRLRHDKVTCFFAFMVLLIILSAVFAPLISPFDPYKESVISRLKPFGWRNHILGTDELGRDMLSRILHGGRVSLLMGIVPVVIASCVGGMLGALLAAVFAAKGLGGTGYPVTGSALAQFKVQALGVGATIVWTVLATAAILFVCHKLIGLRAGDLEIEDGLDLSTHGERATPT